MLVRQFIHTLTDRAYSKLSPNQSKDMLGITFTSVAPIVLAGLILVQRTSLPPRPATAPAVDEIIYKGFPFPRDIKREELEKILGHPASVSEKQADNRRFSRLQFPGLAVELFGDPTGARSALSSIELSDNSWHFPAKLRIGSTRSEMIKLLGKPDIDRSSEAVYGCYECVWDDKVYFIFEGDRIKNIKWNFYLN